MLKVTSIRPAPEGFSAHALALFTFTWEPTEHDGPVKVCKYLKPVGNAAQGKDIEVMSIVGASSIRFIDAVLMDGENTPWITTGELKLPDDVRRALTTMTEQQAERQGIIGGRAPKAGSHGSQQQQQAQNAADEFPPAPVTKPFQALGGTR